MVDADIVPRDHPELTVRVLITLLIFVPLDPGTAVHKRHRVVRVSRVVNRNPRMVGMADHHLADRRPGGRSALPVPIVVYHLPGGGKIRVHLAFLPTGPPHIQNPRQLCFWLLNAPELA